jgi:hypothetical protein
MSKDFHDLAQKLLKLMVKLKNGSRGKVNDGREKTKE